ncbi:MAG: hypothetical protein ACEQSR_14170 [Candidatus Methylacidiphilales bacterium]
MKKTKCLTILLGITICFLGCKEQVGPCGDPVAPFFRLKIIDKLSNQAACKVYDSIEFKSLYSVKTIKFMVYKYSSDSLINFNFSKGDTILFRFDSIHNFDTLIPFSTSFSGNGGPCSQGGLVLDSIYHNNKKIELNTIYY